MALHTSETLHLHYMKSDPTGGGCNYGWTADFRFKLQAESSHAQNLYMVLMLFSSSHQAFPVISDMLCRHYLNLLDGKLVCGDGEICPLFLQSKLLTSISHLFEFGSVYQARFLYCVLQRHRSCTVSKPHENTVFTWLISPQDLLLPSISLHFPKTADCCRNPLATNQTLILCKDSPLWSWSLDTGF